MRFAPSEELAIERLEAKLLEKYPFLARKDGHYSVPYVCGNCRQKWNHQIPRGTEAKLAICPNCDCKHGYKDE